MALPQSRFNIASAAKKKQEPDDVEGEARRRAMKKRANLKPMEASPEEEVINKRKMVTY